LRRLPQLLDARLLVGAGTADDAGVFRLDRKRALVQTVDFFTPIVDEPFLYGQIAAANALSDVYAMGGRPLIALNIMGMPTDKVSPQTIHEILRGGMAKAKEARCVVVGGHTIRNPEPIYGMAVTGLVSPHRIMTNANGRPGDLLVLTKPLGTGIVTTGIKRGLTSPSLSRRAVALMRRLNSVGATLAERGLVRGGTDVTGFGLLGHLSSLCLASKVSAELQASTVPPMMAEVWKLIRDDCVPGGTRENLRAAERHTVWEGVEPHRQILLADAQTSGGLLLCVPPSKLGRVQDCLIRERALCSVVIGHLVKQRRTTIRVLA